MSQFGAYSLSLNIKNIFILKIKKLWMGEILYFVQDSIASEWHSWNAIARLPPRDAQRAEGHESLAPDCQAGPPSHSGLCKNSVQGFDWQLIDSESSFCQFT